MGLSDRDELVLGLLAAPGRPTEVAEALAEDHDDDADVDAALVPDMQASAPGRT